MVWNIPVACNRASADFLISSPLTDRGYQRQEPDYGTGAREHRAAGAAFRSRRAA